MRIVIAKNGKKSHFYEVGDIVKQVSTDKEFEVGSVDKTIKAIVVKDTNELLTLSTDIRPTVETSKKATIVNLKESDEDVVLFAKLKEDAIIPSKEDENGDYDIYANFEEDDFVIMPQTISMIPTGICSAFSKKYKFLLEERGSSGSKGMALRCGVIDSGYRGEWFVAINNTTDKVIIITKRPEFFKDKLYANREITIYPYTKAICQAGLVIVPRVKIKEISATELQAIPSKRGDTKLGASGK